MANGNTQQSPNESIMERRVDGWNQSLSSLRREVGGRRRRGERWQTSRGRRSGREERGRKNRGEEAACGRGRHNNEKRLTRGKPKAAKWLKNSD